MTKPPRASFATRWAGTAAGGPVVFDLLSAQLFVTHHVALAPPRYMHGGGCDKRRRVKRGGASFGLRGRAEIVHDRVRRLFADNPEAVVADTPVLREPFVRDVPVQLVHGLDVRGELVSWLESELMPLGTLGRRLGRGGWRGWPSDGASNALAAHLLAAKLNPRDVRTEPQER